MACCIVRATVRLEFVGQPFTKDEQLGKLLPDALGKAGRDRLWIAVAWAKASGLSRLFDAIMAFRRRGGRAEIIVGVDEGGATWEGLQLALELFDVAYVFHDPGSRTFHPKVYVVEGPEAATAFIGSGNLTRGGLFTNYESGLAVDLDMRIQADVAVLAEIRGYYDALRGSGAACQRLDQALFARLQRDATLRITSETTQNRLRRSGRAAAGRGPGVFGAAVGGLAQAPAGRLVIPEEDYDEDSPALVVGEEAETPEGFWKTLSPFDASQSSAPGQIIIPIAFLDFFVPMRVQVDERATGGVRQSDIEFTATFKDGTFVKVVTTARAILYEPAVHHPRPNRELRFTFRDRAVFDRLSGGDVLVFRRRDGNVVIERRPEGSMGPGRFGPI